MSRLSTRALVVVGCLLTAGCLLAPAPARAAALGQCTTTRGTIVAVDFGHWGGPVVRGCGVTASGATDASGYALLADGGFTTAGDQQDGPGFICRLGDAAFASGAQYPTVAQDACNRTPPASAYWSYWLAEPGSTHWVYSPRGVLADRPVAGEVQLWQYGGTDTAGTTGAPADGLIAQLRARNATVVTAPSATVHAPGATPTAGVTTSRGTAVSPTAATTARAGARAGSSSAASRPATVGGATASPGRPTGRIVTAAASSPAARHAGSPVPIIVTAVLVAALGGGGLLAARRRRS